jgi:hypothetical protein
VAAGGVPELRERHLSPRDAKKPIGFCCTTKF